MAVHRSSKRQSYATNEDERLNLMEHFEQVQVRIDDFVKQGKGLAVVLKKRVSVGKDHVKNVHKMVQAIHDDNQTKHMKFQGSLEASWNTIKEQLTTEASHISQVTSSLENQALHPLQSVVLSDLDKRFRAIISDGRKLIKDYSSSKAALQKSMDKYYSVVSDWEGVMLELFHEQGDSWNPAPGNKLYDREAQLSRKVQEGKQEYEASLEQFNQLQQDIFTNHFPGVFESLKTTAQNMVAIVNSALKCFSEMQSQLSLTNGSKGIPAHEQFSAVDYCQTVIFQNIKHSTIPHPPPYEFHEFAYKDETLMIHARKIQYLCMSKLSPQELASRAHQFLADGDKKKQNVPHKALSSVQEEGSKQLISLCLDYLKQPTALKEEGLFRVSGDAAVMKSLHSDFLSGKATTEYLRMAVMDQRDPNTISGLLKLHLREHPFLCADSVVKLEHVLNEGEKEKIMSTVLEELTSSEVIILTKLMSLLNKMVQTPWKEQNKMSAHTLGIACGLSLFPNLEPSKATFLTEYFIVKYDTLVDSHTVL